MREIVLILHDLRSTHNVWSLLRTSDGLAVDSVYITGYTPYPRSKHDTRLPHIVDKLTNQIRKTALGAEVTQKWEYHDDVEALIGQLRRSGYSIVGLEQNINSIKLHEYKAPDKIALILGREVEGLDSKLIDNLDSIIEIPMFGAKESFNVVQATAMALYHLRFS